MSSTPSYSSDRGTFGSVDSVGSAGVFGQVMGLVAATLGVLTLGAYVGRNLGEGPSVICFLIGLLCIFGLELRPRLRGTGRPFAARLRHVPRPRPGGELVAFAEAAPGVVWQAAAATGLFIAALGATGYAIRSDLSGGDRVLFLLLLALIVYGFVTCSSRCRDRT